MHDAGTGLTDLSTEELEKLLRLIHHGELSCPIARSTLMAMGLNRISESCSILLGLETRAVRAVLVSVLAERKK